MTLIQTQEEALLREESYMLAGTRGHVSYPLGMG
jgi:hypothetical protein